MPTNYQESSSRLQVDLLEQKESLNSPSRSRATTSEGTRRRGKIGCVGWATLTDTGSATFCGFNDEHHKRPAFTNPHNISEV